MAPGFPPQLHGDDIKVRTKKPQMPPPRISGRNWQEAEEAADNAPDRAAHLRGLRPQPG